MAWANMAWNIYHAIGARYLRPAIQYGYRLHYYSRFIVAAIGHQPPFFTAEIFI